MEQGYDDVLARLTTMAALVEQGVEPDEAALRARAGDPDPGEPPAPVATLGDPDSLVASAVGFDADRLTRALDEGFALGDFEDVVDGWLLPALHRLGVGWSEGRVSVAEEHFASASVQRRLATLFDTTPRVPDGPRVLVGLAPRSRHELGVLTFAVALRRRGLDVVYLGGDVPLQAWVTAVTNRPPVAVVIAVPAKEDVPPSRELVAALAQAAPRLPVLVGGQHQDLVADAVTRLGHRVRPAAERLTAALRAKV